VLSASSLDAESREALRLSYGSDLSFADLASLRRQSLRTVVAGMRETAASTVVLAGSAGELRLFGDYLVALAFLRPRARRELQAHGLPPRRLGLARLAWSLGRIAAGLACGLATLVVAWLRVAALGRARVRPRSAVRTERCLYLKPAPFFGVSVGGSVGHVAGVANALAGSGATVRLLSPRRQALVEPLVEQVVVEPDFLVSPSYELNQQRYQAQFVKAARASAREFGPDFVYQRYGLNDLSGVLLRRLHPCPLVLEFNGSEVWAQRHWGIQLGFEGLAGAIERVNLACADLVVVVSAALVDQAVALGADPQRVFFYPNCVDPLVFDPARFGAEERSRTRQALGVPQLAQLFTFVGTFGHWHGTDVLAAAIRRLIDTDRGWLTERRAHFLFVGDGPLSPKVRGILGGQLGAPFVTLAGMLPQHMTPGILGASDVLLSPHVPNPDGTPFFGSPTKLFEYMAMAKPIIASDLDQIGWVLRGWRPGTAPPAPGARPHLRSALLVEPGSVDSLVSALREVLELTEPERAALGAQARGLVLAAFTWDKNVRAVLARLRELAAPREG